SLMSAKYAVTVVDRINILTTVIGEVLVLSRGIEVLFFLKCYKKAKKGHVKSRPLKIFYAVLLFHAQNS
ncbi:MAG: hypothetical protein K2P30_11760, partial [Lachnospiraceae bacterium]|nr:hypothetical protein [Lachnospiraceae bacterium]